VLNEPHRTALKVGPHATRIVEPRQARKGATVRRPSRVPWEYLTGVGSEGRSQFGSIDGGCTVTVYEVYERVLGLKRGWAVSFDRRARGASLATARMARGAAGEGFVGTSRLPMGVSR
jgi:hypothetical protein